MTDISCAIPSHLLDAPLEARMNYFRNEVTVSHPAFRHALDELDALANPWVEQRVVLLLGGTGVGKTALMKALVQLRHQQCEAAMAANRKIIPAIFAEIRAPDKGGFQFSTLYRDALALMSAALPEKSLPIMARPTADKILHTLAVEQAAKRNDAYALELRFHQNLIEREVGIACFDEAINIFKIGKPDSERKRGFLLKEQADKLKSIVNLTPTTLILAGAYDFFEMTLTSGQNARRSQIVHVEPYTEKTLQGFIEGLLGLLSHLPVKHAIDPSKDATELYLQALGCIGILSNLLLRALYRALTNKRDLTMDDVRAVYFTAAQLEVMRREMLEGSKRVREVTSLECLAQHEPPAPDQSDHRITGDRLKPGETKPSHRHNAANKWNEQ